MKCEYVSCIAEHSKENNGYNVTKGRIVGINYCESNNKTDLPRAGGSLFASKPTFH